MSDAVALLVNASLRVTGVLATAWLITVLLRRSSASARHTVWTCAIGIALLTPLLLQVPSWHVPIPDRLAQWSPSAGVARAADGPLPLEPAFLDADATSNEAIPASGAAEPIVMYAGAIWAAGFVAVLFYVLMGVVATSRRRRAARRSNAAWMDDGRAVAKSIGVVKVAFAESTNAPIPYVCGVIEPLVVMPTTVSAWDAERLRVVLLHELAHVKRRDCLTHLLTQIACAIYWFHPLSWFAAHRLRIEREQASDDFVLTAGVRASEYADHLVAVARHAFPHPPLRGSFGVAMANRSQLEGRLMVILNPATCRTAPRMARLGAVAFAACAFVMAALRLQAQAPGQMPPASNQMADVALPGRAQEEPAQRPTVSLTEPPIVVAQATTQPPSVPALAQLSAPPEEPAFEVSSIKRKAPGLAGARFEPGGRFRMEGPLVLLIAVAHEATGPVTGGPTWLRLDEYSVEARAATDAPRSEMVKMLRSLLRERMHLVIHRETHEEDALALVLAREGQLGPQLRKSEVDCAARIAALRENRPTPALPQLPNGMPPCISRPRSGDLLSGGMTMDMLAGYLGGEAGRRVVNKTGLDGYYEMSLQHRDERNTGTDSDLPTVFTALSEQLGLRLQSARTTVETIVIDRIDRPTEN